ncbi:MAG TPA: gluconeogenesis factor YvcK family protein [Terriglobales bacterium]|nr:gluconeogenesis factor YvcK family protein [Terriglobales bacterium]
MCFGGGTGLSNLLRGLKRYTKSPSEPDAAARIEQLTAVVAVTDDGGSSGRIRSEFNMLPPGDIRNCLVALAEDEHLLSRMFQYRFAAGRGLEGHSFGNLFITVLAQMTSDFVEAVRLASEVLAIRGRILPASGVAAQLGAEMRDGSFVVGECAITHSRSGVRRVHLIPSDTRAVPETLAAIAEADLITLGPGSLYTSLVPNLLVPGIPEAIAASRATKVFICNLMSQPNETLGMTASDHLQALHEHAGMALFDTVLVNRAPLSDDLLNNYAASSATPVLYDSARLATLGVRVVEGNYLAEGAIARHDAAAVARDLLALGQAQLALAAAAAAPSLAA